MWTPPHFWALALFRENDYAHARRAHAAQCCRRDETRSQILLYTLVLVPLTFLPALLGVTRPALCAGVALLSAMFLYYAIDVYRLREGAAARPRLQEAFRLFDPLAFPRLRASSWLSACWALPASPSDAAR